MRNRLSCAYMFKMFPTVYLPQIDLKKSRDQVFNGNLLSLHTSVITSNGNFFDIWTIHKVRVKHNFFIIYIDNFDGFLEILLNVEAGDYVFHILWKTFLPWY